MSLRKTLAVFGCACLLGGCNGDSSSGGDGEPWVELGTGDRGFEPLEDGQDIQIIMGPQNGFHFLGSLQAGGFEVGTFGDLEAPDNPTTVFRVFDEDDVEIDLDASTYTQGLEAVDAGPAPKIFEMIGRFVRLDILSDAELDGEDVVIEVEITDVNGIVVTDRRDLHAVPSPNNP